MVVIVMKKPPKDEWSKDYDEFNYNCHIDHVIGDVVDKIRIVYNLRLRLRWCVDASKGLLETVNKQTPGIGHVLEGPIAEGNAALKWGGTAGADELLRIIDVVKGAVVILFPQHCSGVPGIYLRKMAQALEDETTDEPTRVLIHRILSVMDDGAKTSDLLPDQPCCLWWSGKCLSNEAKFSSYCGKNDKTKIVCKITCLGAPPPVREPPVDHNTQKEMMAYYYKKQEEHKALIEDDDITFGNSEWADPQGLKKKFNGTENVRIR